MLESRNGRRVVVTGVGVATPCGVGAREFWAGLSEPVVPARTREVTGLNPAAIGLSRNAHGTSTSLNDATEAAAINAVFDSHRPAVTSIKGVTGHALGGSGAVEAVAPAPTFAHRPLPPTFGFGGHNATLLFVPAS
jgi:3-oxoacyl-(acyl-carrier-protein) synthase